MSISIYKKLDVQTDMQSDRIALIGCTMDNNYPYYCDVRILIVGMLKNKNQTKSIKY